MELFNDEVQKKFIFLVEMMMFLMLFGTISESVKVSAAAVLRATEIVDRLNSLVGTTNSDRAGYCLGWVFDQYKALGATNANIGKQCYCAYEAGSVLIQSASRNNILLGSLVFFSGNSSQRRCSCGNYYGHVGIYVGDDYIISIRSSGKILKEKISYWESIGYGYRGWGVPNNVQIDNASVSLWSISDNETFSGRKDIWAKRFDDDNNHYAVFYLDNQPVTGHLTSDENGYFSFWLDTEQYSNGAHGLRVEYVNSSGLYSSEKTIMLRNDKMDEEKEGENPSGLLIGDANGDGKVNNKDVAYIARSIVGKTVLTETQTSAADVNGDGKVNNKDVAYLARYLVGKETVLGKK